MSIVPSAVPVYTAGTIAVSGIPLEALPEGSEIRNAANKSSHLNDDVATSATAGDEDYERLQEAEILRAFMSVRQLSVEGWLVPPTVTAASTLSSTLPLLVRTRFAERSQLHLVRSAMGARTQLTFFDDAVAEGIPCPLARDPSVPNLQGSAIFMKDAGGNEQHQLYFHPALLSSEGSTSMKLERDSETVAQFFARQPVAMPMLLTGGDFKNSSVIWSPMGNFIVYGSNKRNKKDVDVYVMPLTTRSGLAKDHPLCGGKPTSLGQRSIRVTERTGHWSPVCFSADGSRLLVKNYISTAEQRLYVVDLPSPVEIGATFPLPELHPVFALPEGEKAAFSTARFTKDGQSLLLITDHESEFQRLALYDLASGKTVNANLLGFDLRGDVEFFRVSPNRDKCLVVVNEEGNSRTYLVDLEHGGSAGKVVAPLADFIGVISGLDWNPLDQTKVAITSWSPISPSDAWVLDIVAGTLERWTQSEIGGFSSSFLSLPTLVQVKSFDSLVVSGFLFRPPAASPSNRVPLIFKIHGGPAAMSRPIFDWQIQFWLTLGFGVLCPNVRGSDGFGKTFLALDDCEKREDSVFDMEAFIKYAIAQDWVDPARLCLKGGSYGGYMVLATSIHYAEKYNIRCALETVGISNFITFLEQTAEYRRDLRRPEYGDERDPKMRAFLERISPLTRAAELRLPLMVTHGLNDPRVPAYEAEQIVDAVRKNQHECWFLTASDEGHGFTKKSNIVLQNMIETVFMKRHLLGQ